MPIGSFLANIFNKGGGGIIDAIGNVADKFITTPSERQEFNLKVQMEVNKHIELMEEHANKSVELYLKDVADARAMQMAALTQTDTFSKRFIYFFALGIVIMAFSFDFILCFQQIPTKNETIINVVVGTINGTALVSVVSFFFGSSRGSEDKNKTISDLSKKD